MNMNMCRPSKNTAKPSWMHELPNQLDLVSIQRHRIVRGNGDGDYTRQETTHISIQLSSVGDQNKIKKKQYKMRREKLSWCAIKYVIHWRVVFPFQLNNADCVCLFHVISQQQTDCCCCRKPSKAAPVHAHPSSHTHTLTQYNMRNQCMALNVILFAGLHLRLFYVLGACTPFPRTRASGIHGKHTCASLP